jgi:hypothetical protein
LARRTWTSHPRRWQRSGCGFPDVHGGVLAAPAVGSRIWAERHPRIMRLPEVVVLDRAPAHRGLKGTSMASPGAAGVVRRATTQPSSLTGDHR